MNETRLTRIATAFHALAVISLVAFPVLIVLAVFVPSAIGNIAAPYTELAQTEWPINIWIGAAAGLIPFVFAMLAINGMRKLFGLYKRGDPLHPQAGPFIRTIGLNLLLAAILSVVIQPLQSALMSMTNPAGERFVSVALSNSDVGFTLVAGLLLLIGWSMTEASKLAEENKGFV